MPTTATDPVADLYVVVRNDEEQYSIWRTSLDVPAGWHVVGGPRTEDDAIAWIDREWTDMRPKSVRTAAAGS